MSAAAASSVVPVVVVPQDAPHPVPVTAGGCPELLSASIRRAVQAGGDWPLVAGRVAATLRGQLPSPAILTAAQRMGDPSGYQTHLLHVEPDGSFSVSAMVWRPGQQTPVHDHLAWCVTAVLLGTEHEEVFGRAATDGTLEIISRHDNNAGTVSAFAPPGDIHRVRNCGDGTAVSMHVYGTDISRVGSSIRREYAYPAS